MADHQEHFGKKFYQDKKNGYWISTQCPKIRAHVWVWNHFHGTVPKGMHVHHRDGDKSNNDFTNLQIVSVSDHVKIHFDEDPSRREKAKDMADKYRHLTKEWHASDEGIAWHKLHGIKTWNEREPIKICCKICSAIAITKTYHQEFCSNACKSKCRRDKGLDDVEKVCPVCNCKFIINRYKKTKTCSLECGKKIRLQPNT